MARLNYVKSARKDILNSDGTIKVKKGEGYYWWQFAFSKKQTSKEKPDRRQLTRSEHQCRLYDFEDAVNAITTSSPEDMKSEVESLVSELEDYKSELEDRLSNMPDHLQDSSVLNERIEELDSAIGELESIDLEFISEFDTPEDEDVLENELQDWMDEKLSEIQCVSFG